MKTAYKFLRTGLKSDYDQSQWVVGEWREVPAPTEECVGLNCSEYIQDALGYGRGEVLAEVEYGGKVIETNGKKTCQKMRVVKTWDWTKEMSAYDAWAAYAAWAANAASADWASYAVIKKRIHKAWLAIVKESER